MQAKLAAVMFLGGGFLSDLSANGGSGHFEAPQPIRAGDKRIDTSEWDPGGHAAPFLIDLDEDGRRDLVVGSLAGRFRFFLNIGDAAPSFEKEGRWLLVNRRPAQVVNWCCMAVAPQFVDLDADGRLDLTAGSYGGPVYWLGGISGLEFKAPVQLLSSKGTTLLTHPETFWNQISQLVPPESGAVDSFAANIAWTKWDADDTWDLVIGNYVGELTIWRGMTGGVEYGPRGLLLCV